LDFILYKEKNEKPQQQNSMIPTPSFRYHHGAMGIRGDKLAIHHLAFPWGEEKG
jgi:hypothetical protein